MAPRANGSYSPLAQEHSRNPYFRHLLTGHTNSVRAIAGAGTTLISGSYDCTLRSWDLVTGSNTFVFRGHREKVYSVSYNHESELVASGSMDSNVRIWCVKTGTCLHTLEGHTSLVGLLDLAENYLVSAAADATLRIWDPVRGECLANLLGHNAAITCFHHDSKLNKIVSGSDGGLKIWELSSYGYGTPLDHPPPIPAESKLSKVLTVSQTPSGVQPIYGRHMQNLLESVQGVWRVRIDETKIVCACQRENGTWFEVLDFSTGTNEEVEGPGDREEEDEDMMEL
jgi:WD40 repeat protein